ncbi:MAG: hypothetical protein COB51_04560 [Moraxellaceae bacterium]|nr:MAG: hypothetical protein COB51_04560 [Moraxellaceae bacterium]
MNAVIIFLVIGLAMMAVVASVVAVMPSKRQRLVGRMRTKAMALGLKVQFINQAEFDALQLDGEVDGLIWYSYWVPLPDLQPPSDAEQNQSVEVIFGAGLDPQDAPQNSVRNPALDFERMTRSGSLNDAQQGLITEMASKWGERLVAIRCAPNVVRCLWGEPENIDDVAWLAQQLKRLAESF